MNIINYVMAWFPTHNSIPRLIKNFIPFEDLKKGLREVPMLMDEAKKPYKDALFHLLTVRPEDLNPNTLYYLRRNIEFQKELREKLLVQ